MHIHNLRKEKLFCNGPLYNEIPTLKMGLLLLPCKKDINIVTYPKK